MAIPVEERLHRGLGVRRPDLANFLTEPFAERLHVFDDDPAEIVLAKVIWQVSQVINRVPADRKWITVLEATYNLPQDPDLNRRDLTGRLRTLERRHGAGWNVSTINSKLCALRSDYVCPALKRQLPWPPEDKIAAIARAEATYAARGGPLRHQTFMLPDDTFGLLIADRTDAGRRGIERALPQATLHFAVSAAGNLVTTATANFGEVLPVFTSAALLARYQEQVNAPGSDRHTAAVGREVLDALVANGRIALAVNPLGGHDAHGGVHWTAEELAKL